MAYEAACAAIYVALNYVKWLSNYLDIGMCRYVVNLLFLLDYILVQAEIQWRDLAQWICDDDDLTVETPEAERPFRNVVRVPTLNLVIKDAISSSP